MPTLTDAVDQLRRHRILMDETSAAIAAKRAAFELTLADDIAQANVLKAFVAEDEAIVKELGLKAYRATGSKQPAAGVVVKDMRAASVGDPAAALDWCKENMRLFVLPESLDQKALISFALKSKQPTPHVTITSTPQVQIATDLNKILQEAA